MKPLFLIGFMGCGKTTLGNAVARAVPGVRFIDLDDYIEQWQQRSIRAIFAEDGENAFREMEREALRTVAKDGNVLVACGGGTPCFHGNMDIMNSIGHTIWLRASDERLLARLKEGRTKRPLIARLSDQDLSAYINRMLMERSRYYEKAADVFCSDLLETETEVACTVNEFVSKFMSEHNR